MNPQEDLDDIANGEYVIPMTNEQLIEMDHIMRKVKALYNEGKTHEEIQQIIKAISNNPDTEK